MLPKINQMMYIQTESEPDSESVTLRSRVADVDDRNIYIEIPLNEKNRRLYRTSVGEQLLVYYFTQDGVKHLFNSSVQGFRKEAVSLVAIRKPDPEQITKDQRRSYLRVETNLEIGVKLGDKLRFVAVTEDLGGGGASFLCERRWPIEPNVTLSCWLLLSYRGGSISHAKFEGEVVRVLPVEPDKNLVMLRFADITESDQQKIIRYCFERQLELRRD
ncbi:flagellar brake domain-containing protein [Cohnella sp. LGH]|uniref:C-di-GMP-binding flagellar brake protein YcgR n=1 Tax=Cohnella phaseoli TaxID=456490 RepID=A0A3D9IAJ1_9BACL|nr:MULTISPECIES: flagellar brake domain-containing protein [Cohnella]QTH44826.1 flagellar brake domain-containing protein [Cohnella sp. LGH]RED58655.1 c-di-GMP-binding flagellar brake protein YcgR [Cohnella phaseoli]